VCVCMCVCVFVHVCVCTHCECVSPEETVQVVPCVRKRSVENPDSVTVVSAEYTHTYLCIPTHTHTHTHARARTHAHTHTHTNLPHPFWACRFWRAKSRSCVWSCAHHHDPWFAIPLSVTVRDCPFLSVTVRHCPSLSVTVRYCPLLSVTVRYSRSSYRMSVSIPILSSPGFCSPFLAVTVPFLQCPC
jgi:hypothetical protein